jgi:hypothetical protein|tara:strand:- start:90 stop:530 length:441 start_codon:yes stop_codon:yes gene_type:complete
MLNLGCLIDGEDYNRLVPLSSVDSIPAASYIMTVTDGPESDMSTELNLHVIEFQSVNIVVGFTLPESVKIEKEIEFLFTTQPTADRPMPSDIKFVLEFSDEKRSSAHAGNELEKLEYIGTFLEKKYEKTKATFYLLDYKGIGNQEK